MLELYPFTKIVWDSNTTRMQWSDRLNAIRDFSFEVEYQMVKQGLMDANVIQITAHNYEEQTKRIIDDKLTFLPIPMEESGKQLSLRRLTHCVERSSMKTFVVSRELTTAEEFVAALKDGNHRTVGHLLGYPKCCSDAFENDYVNHATFDPCYEIALRTSNSVKLQNQVFANGNGLTNVMLRYFGVKMIPFFPCSYDCQEAQKVAKNRFNLLERLDSDIANTILELLNQPLTWSLHKQIIYVKTPILKGITNGYNCATKKEVIWNTT